MLRPCRACARNPHCVACHGEGYVDAPPPASLRQRADTRPQRVRLAVTTLNGGALPTFSLFINDLPHGTLCPHDGTPETAAMLGCALAKPGDNVSVRLDVGTAALLIVLVPSFYEGVYVMEACPEDS